MSDPAAGAASGVEEAVDAGAPRVKETVRLNAARRAIAQNMLQSVQQAPHFHVSMDVDMSRVVRERAAAKAVGAAPSVNDYFLHAAGHALARWPQLNASLDGDRLTLYQDANVGMVVAVGDKLLVPVLRRANELSVAEVAARSGELAARARNKRLLPPDCEGGTFSVSNLGMFGVAHFTAIINPGQAGILAVGALEPRAVARDGALAIAPVVTMTLSVDHRIADGAAAARFLQCVRAILETGAAEAGATAD